MTSTFHELFKKKNDTHSPHIFQKMEVQGTLPNSLYEAGITLTPKSDKNIERKENYKPMYMNIGLKILINIDVTYKYRCKNLCHGHRCKNP